MSSTGETNNLGHMIDISSELPSVDVNSKAAIDVEAIDVEAPKLCPPLKQKGRKSSEVWSHFTKIFKEGSKKPEKAKCNYCANSYTLTTENGTSTLWKHYNGCLQNPLTKMVKKQKTLSSFQTTKGESESSLGVWNFDQATCRDALARMIIKDELPFKFVEREGFHYFCSVMQPNFKKVSRSTIARDCVNLYASEKKKLKNLFKHTNQRVCFTTDTWTSLQNVNYMCLKAHFIDKDWKLHKRIINFCVISSHKGEAIGKSLETCLIEWGVERLCTLTVDNASSNDVVISYLKKKFPKKRDTFILGGDFFHMRCCAHIINLIVKEGLSEIKDSVSRIRDSVKYVRSSPQREQRFKGCVEMERIECNSSLCLDVATRWNSTYLMLSVAIKFQKAFERLDDEDPLFCFELSDGPPTKKDWKHARFLANFLKKFYDATINLSGTSYVTSNLYFTEIFAIEAYLTAESQNQGTFDDEDDGFDYDNDFSSVSENQNEPFSLSDMAKKMKAKFDKYWGKIEKVNMMMMIAIVLDPRYKLKYVRFCYSELYETSKVDDLTKVVKETLVRIYDEYKKFEIGTSSSSKSIHDMEVDQPVVGGSGQVAYLKSKFQKHLEKEEGDGGKSELERYLDDPCEKDSQNSKFDILSWWKVNSSKYAVLSEIARDVLAIPVSSVTSEAAFSTGDRVIDQFRSSLTPKVVESLICMQDWLRASPLPFEVEENMEDIQDLELALNKVVLSTTE